MSENETKAPKKKTRKKTKRRAAPRAVLRSENAPSLRYACRRCKSEKVYRARWTPLNAGMPLRDELVCEKCGATEVVAAI